MMLFLIVHMLCVLYERGSGDDGGGRRSGMAGLKACPENDDGCKS